MKLRVKMLRGAAALGSAQAAVLVLMFVRNVLLARIVGPEQFGLAIALAIVLSFFEMVGELGVETFILRDKSGNEAPTIANIHSIQLVRGCLAGIIMFASAPLLAQIFSAPEIEDGYRILAIVPVMRGLAHMDRVRLQRDHKYGPMVTTEIVSQLAAIVAIVLVGQFVQSWVLAVAAIFAHMGTTVLVSQILAQNRYLLKWTSSTIQAIFVFGWPLALNSLLVWSNTQIDKALVGSHWTQVELAGYAVLAMLVQQFASLIARVDGAVILPALSRAIDNKVLFHKRAIAALDFFLLLGLAAVIGVAAAGPWVVLLFFGKEFSLDITVFVAMAGFLGLRIARSIFVSVVLALGRSASLFKANLARQVSVALSVVGIMLDYPIWVIPAALAAGEVAFILVCALLSRDSGCAGQMINRGALFFSVMATYIVGFLLLPEFEAILVSIACMMVLVSVTVRKGLREF